MERPRKNVKAYRDLSLPVVSIKLSRNHRFFSYVSSKFILAPPQQFSLCERILGHYAEANIF